MSTETPLHLLKHKLEVYFGSPPKLFDPFEEKSYFTKRIFEGYYGPLASFEKSISIENHSQELINNVSTVRSYWKNRFSHLKPEKITDLKNKEIENLKQKYLEIPKGGKEEESWLIRSLGFTTAYFEKYMKDRSKKFKMWDNQLLYMTLMGIDKGRYSFGQLSTINRAVQLDTGEGKTKCNGLVAAIKILQGKEVIIVEQNYISVEAHAKEMAPFFEDFLKTETGVVIDRSFDKQKISRVIDTSIKSNIIDIHVGKTGQIETRVLPKEHLKRNFIYTGGALIEDSGPSGRGRSWKKQIVYCDHNSLGGDVAQDRQLTTNEETKLVPDLTKRTVLVQEADGLAFDEATNPFQIQVPTQGDTQTWNFINQLFYSHPERYLAGKGRDFNYREPILKSPTQKRGEIEFTKSFYFHLFDCLYKIVNTDNKLVKRWKEKEAFIITNDKKFLYDGSVTQSIDEVLSDSLLALFNDDKVRTRQFLEDNAFIVEAAMEVLMVAKPGEGFLTGEKPVLMDQYGVPLDDRQRDIANQVFLQLYNIWEREGITKNPDIEPEIVEKLKEKFSHTFQVPAKIASKVVPTALYKEFGELLLTSGTLIPISKALYDLYGAETTGVSRHILLGQTVEEKNQFQTKCLDGGIAEVRFLEKRKIAGRIYQLIKNAQQNGQAGLIIMPDDRSVVELNHQLNEFFKEEIINSQRWENLVQVNDEDYDKDLFELNQIRILTGTEEFKERGSLGKSVSEFNVGDIIITTQMAHRDIDPGLSPDVKNNGGLITVVYNPPNERGMWQALQRSVRADTPGKRILLLSEDSVKDIRNMYLIDPPQQGALSSVIVSQDVLREERQMEIDKLFSKSIEGDLSAQRDLYRKYIYGLRNLDGRHEDSIMFTMVKEIPLENIRENIFKLIGKERLNLLENYTDLVTYSNLNKKYPNVILNKASIDQFLELSDDKSRIELLKNLKVYGDIAYIGQRLKIQNMILTTFWSDLLETFDFLYKDFHTIQVGASSHYSSYLAYEGGWQKYLENFLSKDFDLKLYFLTKIENLEI